MVAITKDSNGEWIVVPLPVKSVEDGEVLRTQFLTTAQDLGRSAGGVKAREE